jgi:2-oxoisovalerate dehydrogenase E2 component (dihydrolipoyl transacylase)
VSEVPDDATEAAPAVRTTPRVRVLAKDLGVDLRAVEGSGLQGRVTADDVRRARETQGSDAPPADLPGGPLERLPVSATRREIAANLERQRAIPQVTTFRTLDCSVLEALRGELHVSPLPVVIAALCRVVQEHPLLNASWGGDHIGLHGTVNVGIAVDTERGLVVPVLPDAGRPGIVELSEEVRRLAAAARQGQLVVTDLGGATIAVTNTGSYGSEAGTPILAPGTAVTLAVGAIAPRALVVDGDVVARPACTLSLTFDHRVLDGAAAGKGLTDLVALLQDRDRLRDLVR